jgi:pimeloyl-ACP methyl ester carboxylesterase
MPVFERGAIRIHYVEAGDPEGPPILLIAPGGLRSAARLWRGRPFDPLAQLPGYRLIAMDQRNAGGSTAPVSGEDGWHTYTADQLALMDHLGVERFCVLGMCIGGPYGVGLLRAAPERVRAAVLFQPIGLADNREAFYALFDSWAAALAASHPEADAAAWASYRRNMFGGEFLFNTSEEELAAVTQPILLFMGDDLYHPRAISRRFAALAPGVTAVEDWQEGEALAAAGRAVEDFLAAHAA